MDKKNVLLRKVVKSIANEQYPISQSDKSGNIPSVKLITETLRAQSYKNNEAINDIMDNCFDAFAENGITCPIIQVDYDFSKERNDDTDYVLVADNGGGFESVETLQEAMRLGSELKSNDENLIGCFGIGLKGAAISMGKLLVVLTTVKDKFYTAIMDLDKAVESQSWNFVFIREATDDEVETLQSYASDTMVIISKLDKIKAKDVKSFKQKIMKSSGEVFRYLIHGDPNDNKCNGKPMVFVGGETLYPIDMMCKDTQGSQLLNVDDVNNNFEYEFNGVKVRIKWYYIPTMPDNDVRVQNMKNQGIYVLRGNRQITRATWFDMIIKNPENNHCRAELFFEPIDDAEMGTDNRKTSVSLHDSLISKLHADISRYTKLTKSIYDQTRKPDDIKGNLNLDNVDELLEDKLNTNALTPTLINDDFKFPEPTPPLPTGRTHKGGKHKHHIMKKVQIEKIDGHERDPFFKGIPSGNKKWRIQLNINHPFYKHYKSLNTDGQTLIFNILYTYLIGIYDVFFNDADFKDSQKQALIDMVIEKWSDNVRNIIIAQTT